MSQDGKTKRVVVIGAGASGIGAARTLSAGGAEVIVLEGRDRIGGRMKKHCLTKNLVGSPRAGAEHYVNIQLGANWIHGMESTNPMFEVAQKLGLELYQTSSDDDPGDDVILFDSGARKASAQLSSDKATEVAYGRVSKEDYYESLSRYEWIKEYVDHISVNYDKEDISLQAAFDLALKASESEIFGPCPEPQKRVLTWLYDRVSIDLGAPSSKVSLNCYEEGVSDGAGGEGLVKHVGYSYVLHHLANEFPLDIRLNHAVSKISVCSMRADRVFELPGIAAPAEEQLSSLSDQLSACTLKDGRFVHIECANGESFAADACVITVPVGALQAESIHFSPRPPSVISSVCTSLKLGLMNLVWLWYPHVFWPEECNFLGIARDGSRDHHEGEEVKFTTFLIPPIYDNNGERQPVLMCQIVGPYATTIETMSDQDIAAEATATLRVMFGADHVPDAVGCAHSTWGSDPFARGSWSYFPYRADSSSFGPGQDGAETETVERGVSCPDGAIVDAVRESQPSQPANIGCGGGAQMASAVAVSTTATTSSTTTATSPVGGVRAQVSFVSDVRSNDAHAAVSISQAASSVLHGSASAAVPSAVRKYSDFGCTSDGTDSSSSDSDTDGYEALSTAFDSAGHTTTSTSSSSDEPSSSCGGGRHHAARTEDEVVSAHLYYASEAMSVLNRGTVHGAYLSGIREANKILAFLDDKTKL